MGEFCPYVKIGKILNGRVLYNVQFVPFFRKGESFVPGEKCHGRVLSVEVFVPGVIMSGRVMSLESFMTGENCTWRVLSFLTLGE